MKTMRDAAARTRKARLDDRLRRMAPDVPIEVARRIYIRAYKAGFAAQQRERGTKL